MLNDLKTALSAAEFATDELYYNLDNWQSDVLDYTGNKLIMNCGRQSGKSTCAAIRGLHQAKYYDNNLILILSPSQRQSIELFRKVIDEMTKMKTRPELIEENRLQLTLTNRSRIVSLPANEATIRGFSGVDLLILDEASGMPDELYYSLTPMLAVSEGTVLILSTPKGMTGFFYDIWSMDNNWKKIQIAATQCPRISAEWLEEEKQAIGSYWFSQEYECKFIQSNAELFDLNILRESIIEPRGWEL